MSKPTRKPRRSKQIKFTPKPLTQKERWSEVVVTHTAPTKPDAVMAERVAVKPRKPRKEVTPTGVILDRIKSWDQLSDKTKQRMQGLATRESKRNKAQMK